MIPTDTPPFLASRAGTAPDGHPAQRGDAWLSRQDWRRAVDRWMLGGMDRSELEALKARLVRRRVGAVGLVSPAPGSGSRPALRVLPGGRAARSPTHPGGGGFDSGPGRAA